MSFAPTPTATGPIAFKDHPAGPAISAGFEVRRALPAPQAQLSDPFPSSSTRSARREFITGQGASTCAPHPHIGLATITYLYEGCIPAPRQPGHDPDDPSRRGQLDGIAGRGVTHSERTSAETPGPAPIACSACRPLWGKSPPPLCPPTRPRPANAGVRTSRAEALPVIEGRKARPARSDRRPAGGGGGGRGRLLGPDRADPGLHRHDPCRCDAGPPAPPCPCPTTTRNRGIHVMQGKRSRSPATRWRPPRQDGGVPPRRRAVPLRAGPQGARLIVLGGETLSGPRYIWWNFVASSEAAIHEARAELGRRAAERFSCCRCKGGRTTERIHPGARA